MKVCLAVLLGLPGAGKTTFCRQLLQKDLPFSVVHICYDNFVNIDFEMHQSFKLQRRNVLGRVRKLISCVGTGLPPSDEIKSQNPSKFVEGSEKLVVLIDDNNFYRSMRYDYYKLAKELKAVFCQIYFALPLRLAIERNSQRPERVPTDVVMRVNRCLEPPSGSHKWEERVFVVKESKCDFFQILNFLIECFKLSTEEKDMPPAAVVEQSKLHKVDLLLRRRVGELMKELYNKDTVSDIRTVASDLNRKRRQILDDIRQGLIILEPNENYHHLISLI